MPHVYRDVAVDPSGGLHKVKVIGRQLAFNADPPIELPEAGMFVRLCVRPNGWLVAALKGHDSGNAFLVSKAGTIELGETFGNWPCAFAPDGRLYVRQEPNHLTVYNTDGQAAGMAHAPWASEGIHHIEPDGRVILGNDPSLIKTVQGVKLWQTTQMQGWACGQAECGDSELGGVAFITPAGDKFMRQGYTPHPPRLAVSEAYGYNYLAISGDDTPEPDAVGLEDFYPYVPKAPVLIDLPRIDFHAPAWIGRWHFTKRESYTPGFNCSVEDKSEYPRTMPVVCNSAVYGLEWDRNGRPLLCGVLTTEGHEESQVAQHLREVKALGAGAVYIHVDNADDQAQIVRMFLWAAAAGSAGLKWYRGIHIVGKAMDEFPAGRYGFTINLRDFNYQDANTRRVAVIEAMKIRSEIIFFTGWDECTDEPLKAWIADSASRVPTPVLRPGVTPQEPPKEDAKPEDKPKQKHGQSLEKTVNLSGWARVFSGLAALIAALRRKANK